MQERSIKMTDMQIREAVSLYRTPLYILDLDALKEQVSRFRDVLAGRIGLCYAMKANAFITKEMSRLTDRIEVCSEGEFRLCRQMGIPADRLYVSGVLKREDFVREMLDYGTDQAVYTAESPEHFALIEKECRRRQLHVDVFLRLTSGNQFGMDKDTLASIYEETSAQSFVHIRGIHFFSGTQKKKIAVLEKEIAMLDEFCLQLAKKTGRAVEELEYGPGFFINYFENRQDQLWDDAKRLADVIGAMRFGGRVTIEMGRALAYPCGMYVTEACDCKVNDGKSYCITDGGIHQLHYDGQIRGMYHPFIRRIPGALEAEGTQADSTPNEETRRWTICGSLCTVNDVLVSDYPAGELCPGDLLVFERTGAYSMTEGMSLFLSHELPAVAMYEKEAGWHAARWQQETYRLNGDRQALECGDGDEADGRAEKAGGCGAKRGGDH